MILAIVKQLKQLQRNPSNNNIIISESDPRNCEASKAVAKKAQQQQQQQQQSGLLRGPAEASESTWVTNYFLKVSLKKPVTFSLTCY